MAGAKLILNCQIVTESTINSGRNLTEQKEERDMTTQWIIQRAHHVQCTTSLAACHCWNLKEEEEEKEADDC